MIKLEDNLLGLNCTQNNPLRSKYFEDFPEDNIQMLK